MTTYTIRIADTAEYVGDDEVYGRWVVEQSGEWIGTLPDEPEMDGSRTAVELYAAHALMVHPDTVWATPTGANINGDAFHPNTGVTATDWDLTISDTEPKGWGWGR